MIAHGGFQVGQPVGHLHHRRLKGFLEGARLGALPPVREVGMLVRLVLHDQVIHPPLQPVRPRQHTLHARRVRRNHSHSRQHNPAPRHRGIHLVKPGVRHAPGASAHVGQNDRRTAVQIVQERVQSFRRVNVDLGHLAAKEMRQATTGLVLSVQIQQRHRNLVFLVPLRQSRHDVGLAHSSFAAHRQNHSLSGSGLGLADRSGHREARRLFGTWRRFRFEVFRAGAAHGSLPWFGIGD